LYDYVYEQVTTATEGRQTPKLINYGSEGTLVLAANPHPPLQAELQKRLKDIDYKARIGAVYELKTIIEQGGIFAKSARDALYEIHRTDRDRGVHDAARHCLVDIGELPGTEPKGKKAPPTNNQTGPEIRKQSLTPKILIGLVVIMFVGGLVVFWQNQKNIGVENSKPQENLMPKEQAVDQKKSEVAEPRRESSAPRKIDEPKTVALPKAREIFQDDLKAGGKGPKMVVLPAGSFLLGSTERTDGEERFDNERQHKVAIENPFALGQFPVTNAEFRRFRPDHDSGSYRGHSLNGDDQPVVQVSWQNAVDYAKWLGEQTGKRYRLPTEAEWEYAARAGTQTRRYWGDDPDDACKSANVYDRTAKEAFKFDWPHHDCDDGYAVSSPVGRFEPNGFKLYDMLGNVWEWTCSAHDKDYGGAEQKCLESGDTSRSLRGGSWYYEPRYVRSAGRYRNAPSRRDVDIGFRVAQDL
jgi:formylglycine-generating enzyme required for sulfatase activity